MTLSLGSHVFLLGGDHHYYCLMSCLASGRQAAVLLVLLRPAWKSLPARSTISFPGFYRAAVLELELMVTRTCSRAGNGSLYCARCVAQHTWAGERQNNSGNSTKLSIICSFQYLYLIFINNWTSPETRTLSKYQAYQAVQCALYQP